MPAETFQTAENSITCMLATPWRGKGGNLLSAPHEDREPQRSTTSHKCFKPKRPPAHLVLRHTRMWPDQRVEPGPKNFNRLGTGRTATLELGDHPPALVVGSPPTLAGPTISGYKPNEQATVGRMAWATRGSLAALFFFSRVATMMKALVCSPFLCLNHIDLTHFSAKVKGFARAR